MKPQPEHDDLARQYLLGRLPDAQREQLGERMFADEEYFDTVQAVEMDLRDAYARNELRGRERDDFETHLLRTERQRKASRMAVLLAKALAGRRVERRSRWMQWALVAAAGVAIPSAFYAVWLQQQVRLMQTPHTASLTRPASEQLPAVVSLFLPNVVLRGAETSPELKLPAQEALVKLEIEVPQAGPYLVTLADASGNEVFRQEGVPSSNDTVTVWLSATALPNGPLDLRLSGGSVEEKRRLQVRR